MNNLVTLTNNTPTTTSLKVAELFGKRHDNVIQSIQTIQTTLKSVGRASLNFQECSRIVNGRDFPIFTMDRDAFSVLAFGFTGEKALGFRIDYVKAFNNLELEVMKTKAGLFDLTDLPAALILISERMQQSSSQEKPLQKEEAPFPAPLAYCAKTTLVTTTKISRNMKTASVTHQLSLLGLHPRKTTDWLVKEGFLKVVKRNVPCPEFSHGKRIKVPTATGKRYFEAQCSGGLYLTSEGKEFLAGLRKTDQIPANCLMAA